MKILEFGDTSKNKIVLIQSKFHCENALFNPEIMVEELDKIFGK